MSSTWKYTISQNPWRSDGVTARRRKTRIIFEAYCLSWRKAYVRKELKHDQAFETFIIPFGEVWSSQFWIRPENCLNRWFTNRCAKPMAERICPDSSESSRLNFDQIGTNTHFLHSDLPLLFLKRCRRQKHQRDEWPFKSLNCLCLPFITSSHSAHNVFNFFVSSSRSDLK